jgi:hypothetical protein
MKPPMNRPRILVLALALAFSSVSAFSLGLESKGSPAQNLPGLGNYGMGVSARTGLKSIVPSGWKVYVHQSAKLPDTLDWSLSDTWIQALERLTTNNDLSILVDWESKSVMVRTQDIAVQENATRQEIEQAASTPLPKFSTPSDTQKQAPVEAGIAQTNTAIALGTNGSTLTLGESPLNGPAPVVASLTTPTTESSPGVSVSGPVVDVVVAVSAPAEVPASAALPTAIAEVSAEPEPSAAQGGTLSASAALSAAALPEAAATPLVTSPTTVALATPLPKSVANASQDPPAVAPASLVRAVAEPVLVQVAPLPVIRMNPTEDMISSQKSSFSQRADTKLASTVEYAYSDAVAYNKPTAKRVVESIAAKYKLRVVWALADDYALRGPVTLLADNAGQDLELLYKAIGRSAPISLELSESEGAIRVYKRGGPRPILVPVMASASALEATGRMDSMPLTALSPRADSAFGAGHRLKVAEKQPLEDALNGFAKELGYSFEWQVTGGFEANSTKVYDGSSVAKVLIQVLPPLGLSADVYTREKRIVVRPGEARN